MKKILKWAGLVAGGLIVVAVLAAAGLIVSSELRFTRVYDLQAEAVTIPTDAASLATGQRWAEIHCQGCHGADLGGGAFFDDPAIGYVDAANLTAGQGGVGATYTDADWVRAIRHGVKGNGTSVFIMPSDNFYYLNDADLGSLIAYLKTVPPVDRTPRPRSLSLMAKLLYGLGAFPNLLYAETIAHDVRPAAPAAGVTEAYGEYLVNAHGCRACHGQTLAGGYSSEPGAPLSPNLTPGGELGQWSAEDFDTALRTGVVPSGRQLSEAMPWQGFSHLTDDEVAAIWLYLQAVPAETTVTE